MFFCPAPNFFSRAHCKAHRQQAEAEQLLQTAAPKVPDGAQDLAEQDEEQHRPAEDPRRHVEAQLPVAEGHGEVEHGGQGEEAVEAVKQRQPPPPRRLAEGAQQIVEQAQHAPQEERGQKGGELLGNLDAHQPNRRDSRPPRPAPCSSY